MFPLRVLNTTLIIADYSVHCQYNCEGSVVGQNVDWGLVLAL